MKLRKKSVITAILCSMMIFAPSVSNADGGYIRYSGENRTKTSMDTIKDLNRDTMVFVDGYSFPDALSAMNIVNRFDAKLILASKNDDYTDYLKKSSVKKIYVVGGGLSRKQTDSFKNICETVIVKGQDRYDTNSKTLEISGYKNVGVATGKSYPDALSSFSLIKQDNLGLMLVNGEKPYNTGGRTVKYTFGGVNSVKQNGGERISGNDRYDTSIKIAEKTNARNLVFVSGKSYPDALSAMNVANAHNGDVVLTPSNGDKRIPVLKTSAENIYVVGGPQTLPNTVIDNALAGKSGTGGQQSGQSGNSQYVYYNFTTDSLRIGIDKNYVPNLNIKTGYDIETGQEYISFSSKYVDTHVQNGGGYGYIGEIVIRNPGKIDAPEYYEIGTLTKGNISKKVTMIWNNDIPFGDENNEKLVSAYTANTDMVKKIVSDSRNFQALNGWKFTAGE